MEEGNTDKSALRRHVRVREVVQAGILFLLWVLFSGRFQAFHLATGAIAVLFVLWLDRKLGPATLGDADRPLRLHPVRLVAYVFWLGWQMVLSAWQVARVILNPERHLRPKLVLFRSPQPHVIAKVVLGNSITLTPGTLTLDIEGDRYLVHALSADSAEGLLSGDMQRRVARLFRAGEEPPVFDAQVLPGVYRL
jgi:multicomponent Na+:H+ antiporter subunit E